ncbi:hypothetical protein GEMRC1_001268 [Eukaryota sp. GEM-RC1]
MTNFFSNLDYTVVVDLARLYPIRSACLVAYVLSSVWSYFLAITQYRRYKTKTSPPEALKDVIPEDKFKKSRLYSADKAMLGFCSSILSEISTIATLTTPLFSYFWNFSHTLAVKVAWWEVGEITTSIALLLISIPISIIRSLPFSLYGTFVIEERYGFNTMTKKLFVIDLIKSTLLKLVIAPPMTALVIYIIRQTGPMFYIYLAVVLFFLSLLFSVLIPNFIMPLFNKFSPIEDEELNEKIHDLSSRTNFQISEVFSMDASRRSKKSNAFFIGLLPRARKLVLYDTLIEQLTSDEVIAVLSHEIGHKKKKHTLAMMVLQQVNLVVFLFLFSKALEYQESIASEFMVAYCPIVLSMLVFSTVLGPSDDVISIMINALFRMFERQADRFAVRVPGLDLPLKEALIKLNVENLSDIDPHPLTVFACHSHPPLLERMKFIDDEKKKIR